MTESERFEVIAGAWFQMKETLNNMIKRDTDERRREAYADILGLMKGYEDLLEFGEEVS